MTPALVPSVLHSHYLKERRPSYGRDYEMARLREMSLRGGGAMHKQTMIHKNTQDLHTVKETDKHTNTTWSN